MEDLFWNVFHNKYLFNLILWFVVDYQVVYDNIRSYNINNRQKLREITSLKWIIENNAVEILKCNLKHNEYITIDDSSLLLLFSKRVYQNYNIQNIQHQDDKALKEIKRLIFKEFKESTEYRTGDEFKILEKVNSKYENRETIESNLNEMLLLLLKYKLNEMIEDNFISELMVTASKENKVEMINCELIKLVLSEPYSVQVTYKMLKCAIKHSNPEILEILINSCGNNDIIEKIKNTSLSNSIDNSKYREQMMELILNYPTQLYNVPISVNNFGVPFSNNSEQPKKKYKKDIMMIVSGSGELIEYNDGGDGEEMSNDEIDNPKDENGVQLIKFRNAFKIKSSFVKTKLFELGYFTNELDCNIGSNCSTVDEKLKKLFHFYSIQLKLQAQYLKMYSDDNDETYDGIDLSIIYKCAFDHSNYKLLKYLLKKEFKIQDYQKKINQINMNSIDGEDGDDEINNCTNEFIKYYTIGYNQFKLNNFLSGNYGDSLVLEYLFSIKSNEEYQDAINSIDKECCESFREKIPLKWFDIGKLKFDRPNIIENTQTIDMIIDNKEYIDLYIRFKTKMTGSQYHFKSIELIEYAKSKCPLLFHVTNVVNQFRYAFSWAIYTCDIDSIKSIFNVTGIIDHKYLDFPQIEPEIINGTINWSGDSDSIPFSFSNQPISKVIELLNYFNSTGYKELSKFAIIKLLQCISQTRSYSNDDLLLLKINFNNDSIPIDLLLDSIYNISQPRLIRIILNNWPNNNQNGDSLNSIIDEYNSSLPIDESFKYYLAEDGRTNTFDQSTLFYSSPTHTFDQPNLFDSSPILIVNGGYSAGDVIANYCTSGQPISDIIETIEIILSSSLFGSGGSDEILTCQNILNILYKKLVRSHYVNFNDILKIRNTISIKWFNKFSIPFVFNHTFYHSFYYIGIKSLKLMKFILSLPKIIDHFNERLDYFEKNKGYENEDFYHANPNEKTKLLQLLDPNLYTFDFINSLTVVQLFENLSKDLLFSNTQIYSNTTIYHSNLESSLYTLLEVRDFQLFNCQLNLIQQFKIDNFSFSVKLVETAYSVLSEQRFNSFIEFNEVNPIKDSILSHKLDYIFIQPCFNQFIKNNFKDFTFKLENEQDMDGGSLDYSQEEYEEYEEY